MQTRSRAGFTLVELMVVMALTLFVMVILSQAFVMSLDTFSNTKGIGDMQQNLRVAEVMLRDDLGQDHFEGKRRLSDMTLTGGSQLVALPPQAGFFAVRRATAAGSPNYVFEGNDASGLPSFRATDHMIYMAVKRKGNRQENIFSTSLTANAADLNTFFSQSTAYNIPGNVLPFHTWTPPYVAGATTGTYSSQWAEVMYYLVRQGSSEQPNNPNSVIGTPTYGLYRAQFVMVPDGTNVSNKIDNAAGLNFASLSCNTGATKLTFFSPADAALGQRVVPNLAAFNPAADSRFDKSIPGTTTLVCPNVISFQVQVMPIGSAAFDDMSGMPSALLYDTTKFSAPPAGYMANGLKGIQVTLRVYDNKTKQTRQVTVVQDL